MTCSAFQDWGQLWFEMPSLYLATPIPTVLQRAQPTDGTSSLAARLLYYAWVMQPLQKHTVLQAPAPASLSNGTRTHTAIQAVGVLVLPALTLSVPRFRLLPHRC